MLRNCHGGGELLGVKPSDPLFAKFEPKQDPGQPVWMLKGVTGSPSAATRSPNRRYSRIMETYLTVCVPELQITVRQYAWVAKRLPDFWRRMTNDCLRFQTRHRHHCYGMNDHGYRRYEEAIGTRYRENSTAIVRRSRPTARGSFKARLLLSAIIPRRSI